MSGYKLVLPAHSHKICLAPVICNSQSQYIGVVQLVQKQSCQIHKSIHFIIIAILRLQNIATCFDQAGLFYNILCNSLPDDDHIVEKCNEVLQRHNSFYIKKLQLCVDCFGISVLTGSTLSCNLQRLQACLKIRSSGSCTTFNIYCPTTFFVTVVKISLVFRL